MHHICRKAFEIIDLRGEGALLKEEVKEFLVFAKENIYMNTNKIAEDNTLEQFDEVKFEKIWEELPKKYFPPNENYEREIRVEMKPLWEIMEKDAELDGVLFNPFRQLEINDNDDGFI